MNEWQPIETAPKGKMLLFYITDFLLTNSKGMPRNIQTGHISETGICIVGGHFAFDIGHPTHWMPLPSPPQEKNDE